MKPSHRLLPLAAVMLLPCCASAGNLADLPQLQRQVMDTERAFARTMACAQGADEPLIWIASRTCVTFDLYLPILRARHAHHAVNRSDAADFS